MELLVDYYQDQDGDGYGDSAAAANAQYCPPGGQPAYSLTSDDCNDADAGVHPRASELCGDGIDQDCSGNDLACGCGDGIVQGSEQCDDGAI